MFVDAIICLCSLGLVKEDWTLAQTAAAELLKLEPHTKDEEVDLVLSKMFLLQGQSDTAKRFLAKSVHRYPWKSELWSRISEFLYQNVPTDSVALMTSNTALKLEYLSNSTHRNDSIVGSVLSFAQSRQVAGLVQLSAGKPSRAHLSRAVFMNPSNADHWQALSIELSSHSDEASLNLSKSMADNSVCVAKSDAQAQWAQIISCNAIVELHSFGDFGLTACMSILDAIASQTIGVIQQMAFMVLGKLLYILDDLPSSIQSLKQSILLQNTPWVEPILQLASVYEKSGRLLACKCCLEYACHNSPSLISYLNLAMLSIKLGDYSSAFGNTNEAAKLAESTTTKYLQTLIMTKMDSEKNEKRIKKNKLALEENGDIPLDLMGLI